VISHDHVLQSVQVMHESEDNAGQEALQHIWELRHRIIEDPGMELDKETKRLRQAIFKQQYKLRQERSCTELTEIEQEALMACGVAEVLGEIDVENGVGMANISAPAATAPTWN
jgi:flagellar biosynthesis component FlhA